MAIQAMGSESARQDVKQLKQAVFDYPPANPLALSHGLAILAGCNLRDELKSLTLPVKGIYGRLDSLVAIKSIESMANQMHNFEYRVLAKASHAPFISHRVEFLQHFDELYNQIG
jgi:pimeloyl-[acyl-carrier protein] methyl ester esterase